VKIELVGVEVEDGLRLDGALAGEGGAEAPACLMMHGVGGNFYAPFFTDFAEQLATRGWVTVRANNRGHDLVSRGAAAPAPGTAPRPIGAAYERMADATHDWRVWIDFLAARGHREIVVWGHSLGAVKTAAYLATARDARVLAAVLASPPQFSYDTFMASSAAGTFREHLDRAQRMLDEGRADELMVATFPTPFLCSPATYLEKYGAPSRYDVVRHLERVDCPTLVLLGSLEPAGSPTFQRLPAALTELAATRPGLQYAEVPGGDHQYTGLHELVLHRVLDWLAAEGSSFLSPH
jgi:alpha-beta hydrolase superfamily lysophospholipase